MQRTSSIRWRDKDIVNLRKTVSKFNAKLTRISKAHPEFADFLPERLSVKTARESIHTRNDFNRFISSHERFMKKGAERPVMSESGAKSTAWELGEVKRNISLINRRRKAERKQIAPSPYKGNMGTVEANNLRPKKNRFNVLPQKVWKEFVKQVERESASDYSEQRAMAYMNNYIKAIYKAFGVNAYKLADRISKIDPIAFFRVSQQNADVLSIDFPYDDLEVELKINEINGRLDALGY